MKTWRLYVHKPLKDYPSRVYLWVDPSGIVRHCRSITSLGFSPIEFNPSPVGLALTDIQCGYHKVNTKLSQEQLSMGWL